MSFLKYAKEEEGGGATKEKGINRERTCFRERRGISTLSGKDE